MFITVFSHINILKELYSRRIVTGATFGIIVISKLTATDEYVLHCIHNYTYITLGEGHDVLGESKKARFERLLLPKYRSNDIVQYLIVRIFPS